MGKGVFQGLPLQLSGLRKLLDLMDWEEIVFPFVSFGAVGAAEVRDEDDIFLIVCPQNIVGASILPNLQAMCEKAGDRQVILLNPKLVDIPRLVSRLLLLFSFVRSMLSSVDRVRWHQLSSLPLVVRPRSQQPQLRRRHH